LSALNAEHTMAVAESRPQLHLLAPGGVGAADQFQKVNYGQRLSRDLGAEFDRNDGGRHFTPEDHPEAIAAAINDICDVTC
jgi:hypothetical protein